MTKLSISNSDKKILEQILSKYPYRFYAYGSRTKGTARKYSDLDLCYQEEIPSYVLIEIKKDLEESNLPFIVELVNWKYMRPTFQKMIKKDLLPLS
ncbi:nucleotidyltransferase family protein [endosymbiont GvMRE of Glomus versiforme]|uniref:nucleotidyltransferase family protein n=1 Tax=endosymbiont GvMRE of Glomus versiforme TaxID=2039283 RepID=UPI000ED0270F|nr:nucleotidyltransferase domain-containing protein [endosymbiont GvMRE of Glomus versiforme]RHZ35268.1 DNA polymerase beta subunit [endosymbiont GvMRE of Glomus versiforme]